MQITVIHPPTKEEPFLVINKPSGLPSAPINPEDKNNALSQALVLYPQIATVKGRKTIEYGLLHRLDTVTQGLLLIAANQNFYDAILELQENSGFIKTYKAVCSVSKPVKEGFPLFQNEYSLIPGNSFFISSGFRPFGKGHKEVRPITQNSSKYAMKKGNTQEIYTTNVKIISVKADKVEVICSITKGYRHQVRCHLAWCGLPIINDSLYNKNCDAQINFSAVGLSFEYNRKKYNF